MSDPLSSDEPLSHAFAKARSGELINGKCRRWLDQPYPLQAGMPVLTDDVVVHGYAERLIPQPLHFLVAGRCHRGQRCLRSRPDIVIWIVA